MKAIARLSLTLWIVCVTQTFAQGWALNSENIRSARVHGIGIGASESEVESALGLPPRDLQYEVVPEMWRYPETSPGAPPGSAFRVLFDRDTKFVRAVSGECIAFDGGFRLKPQPIEELRSILGPESVTWKSGDPPQVRDYVWSYEGTSLRVQTDAVGKAWRYSVIQKR